MTTALITEVRPGLHRIDTPLGDRIASIYIVAGDDEAIMLDTGVAGTIPSHVIPALGTIGITADRIRTVFVTHCDVDHFGGVGDVRRALPRAEVVAHAADRPAIESFEVFLTERGQGFGIGYGYWEQDETIEWMRSVTDSGAIDRTVAEGDRIDLGGIEVVVRHVPGHTHGHIALEVPAHRAVLIGDAVLGRSVDLVDGTPAFPPTYRHVRDYLASIDRLQAGQFDILLTAHYPTMEAEEVSEFLTISRDFVADVESAVLAALSAGPEGVTLREMLPVVNASIGAWPKDGTEGALAYPVAGHLDDLLADGRVSRTIDGDGSVRWSIS